PRVAGRVVLAVIQPFARMAVRVDHAAATVRWPGLSGCRPIGEREGATNQHAASDKIAPIHTLFVPGRSHFFVLWNKRSVLGTRPSNRQPLRMRVSRRDYRSSRSR